MQFVDTHAHLYLDHFDDDREKMIRNALEKNVSGIIMPNIDSNTVGPMNQLCDHFSSNIFPLMGLHPVSVKNTYKNELEVISGELKTGRYYGIGESGIDLYHDRSFLEEQKRAFIFQIELSLKYNLPIVIHARESFGEIFDILDNYKNQALNGVFHAFTGNADQAKKIIGEFGLFLGIGGIVTFKNSGLESIIKEISLEHMVIETDSPFLAPVPYRGKRNESSYIVYIAEKIAQIKNISLNQVADVTTGNAIKIFGLPLA
ncbi:MAG: TatD family hydrolase [Bacteroidales bacterium]|nr:TatD family hydrolase [Bacteroidales bacterium]